MSEDKLIFKNYEVVLKDNRNLQKVYIEITSKCNLNCIMCFRRFWKDKVLEMSFDNYLKVINDLKEFPKLETVYLGGIGEPLVHSKILDIIKVTKEKGFKVEFGTNGTLLNKYASHLIKLGVDKIIVSIDAPDSKIYEDIRGTDFNKVEDNVMYLQELKKEMKASNPNVEIEVVAMKSNIDLLPNILPLATKLGVTTVIISNIMPFNRKLSNEILYDGSFDYDTFIDKMNKDVGKYRVKIIFPKFTLLTERKCQFIEQNAIVIRSDGEVAPCYRLLHSYTEYVYGREKQVNAYSFGNAFKDSLYNIWNSLYYKRFKYKVENFLFPSCTDCPLKDSCDFTLTSDADCFGNTPSCADCLWGRGIIQCP
ncbi:MAG: tungsten cofactor oxidoreductase radical SAM maturase [Caldisericaceae bacterium]